ncbi:unnamed protein product [Adineta steineri]|uniref:Uncharacterized protein n=1 Tax=Adineta steineri TaxID=433720 RepID=A0A813SYJ5_9BILA|nr:unnamed protein product [Adineta steineri]CAF3563922.1 unnamed protein product [Adineta steineri]
MNFRPTPHTPLLATTHHVQPLKCIADRNQPEWPRPVQTDNKSNNNLTVVIVTARPEFKRLSVTMAALLSHLDSRRITEVMLLVPPKDIHLLQPHFPVEYKKYWPWTISIVPDDILLKHIKTDSYRLQMMFKLMVAQIVKTEFYLILDSDCVAVWPIHVEQLLHQNKTSSLYQSIYQAESRSLHEEWWFESERLIQVKLESCVPNDKSKTSVMGVTPSILSRTISLRTLCRLQKLYGDETFLTKMANWALSPPIPEHMWTEYTLYYITGRCTQLFDTYHIDDSALLSSNSMPKVNLNGLSIWSDKDWTKENQNKLIDSINNGLRWRQKEIDEANGQAIIDKLINEHSLFTVLQGRHNVDTKLYHQYFYPLYMKYLQQQKQMDKLVPLIEYMAQQFRN